MQSKGDSNLESAVNADLSGLKELVQQEFTDVLGADEHVLDILETDITPEGHYDKAYLIITDQKVFTACSSEQTGHLELLTQVNIDDIKHVHVEQFTGNGLLTVETTERIHRLVRFSLTLQKEFTDAATMIQQLMEHKYNADQAGGDPLGASLDSDRCPTCGRGKRKGVCPHCIEKTKILKRLLGYVRPYLPQTILSLVLLLTTSLLALAPPYLTGRLVDEVLIQSDLTRLRNMVILLGLIHLVTAGIGGLRAYIMTKIGQGIIRDLRSQVFHHLQYLNMRFFDSVRTGSIMSRTISDTANLQRFITQSTQSLLQQIVMIFAVGAMLFSYDPWLAAVTMAPMPLIILATRWFTKKMHSIYRRIWVRRALMTSVVADSIPGIKVVKSFAQEEQEISKFDHRSDQVFEQHVRAGKFRSMFGPFLQFGTAIGTLLIWGYGGYLVIQTDRLSVGDLVAFLYFVNQFYNPLRQLFQFSDVVMEASTASTRVFDILDTEPEVEVGKSTISPKEIEGRIEFEDVSFAYESHEQVLKDINVTIEPGQMVGLVGSSGSGKTTMVNLIPRLYDVTGGAVKIDGIDIRELDLKTLRDNIGVVLQDPILFHGTIAENIAYGQPDVSQEDIIWAAQAANAHEFIMEFPDGYDTYTGERGLRLSGGQKQRISIARALLKNPKILILDEATSSVDSETEQLIQQAIDRLVENRTTIAIAHRLSTLQNADRLLVVQDGEIVEEGSHQELMKLDGIFARLIRMQSEAAKIQAV